MTRKVYIGSAWPYVNGRLHLGHVAGLLPADVLARYHRLAGDDVLWTSGSDCHGTPITERARAEGVTPEEIATRFHAGMVEDFERLGFSYSLYWATMEPAHHKRVQASFLDLWNKGYIVEGDYHMAHCGACGENRSDREINGTCPKCGDAEARGDQCDACGDMLNPIDLKNATCAKCKGEVRFDTSRELFLDLPRVTKELETWVQAQTHWRENAKAWTQGWLTIGLKPRAITRNIEWGIKVPLQGWEDRRIYVWFEAVHGYLTASMEWAFQSGDLDAWKPFWLSDTTEPALAYYVIGKDNIPFHTLIWPGILMAREGFVLPWHIVSSEYLVFEDKKLSKSKGWVIYAHEFMDRYDPDLLRYFLLANGPESRDTNFTWERFVDLVNSELVNNYSNLVHRLLSFVSKRFDSKVPIMGPLTVEDTDLLAQCEQTFVTAGECIERTEFRRAIETIMQLVQEANRYFTNQKPWEVIKTNEDRAMTIISVGLRVLCALSILTEPFIPTQAKRLQDMLRVSDADKIWACPVLKENHDLGEIAPLFQRLDKALIERERSRLGG